MNIPGDIAANTLGLAGGLLLPESSLSSYSKVVGGFIPGPYNNWTKPDNTPTTSGVRGPRIISDAQEED